MKNEKTMHILLLRHYIIMPMLEEKAAPFLRFESFEKKNYPSYSVSKKESSLLLIAYANENLFFCCCYSQMITNPFILKPKKDHRKGKQKIGENILISFPSFVFYRFLLTVTVNIFFITTQLHDFDKKNCSR